MRIEQWKREADYIADVMKRAPSFDRSYRIGPEEFRARRENVLKRLQGMGLSCGVVFSNEHYNGDVPYLGGNTNVTVESVAGIIRNTHLVRVVSNYPKPEMMVRSF